ncbi:prenylcysteine oxidase 1-like [Glandiceps talaboti]
MSTPELMDQRPTITIIGAGIGGTSCAYYLDRFVGDCESVIIEASSRIGGRIYDVVVDNDLYTIGAYGWTGYQRYIKDLVQDMGLESTEKGDIGDPKFVSPFSFITWDGSKLTDPVELQKAHGSSVEVLSTQALDFFKKMEMNYDQRNNNTFTTMEEYLIPGGVLKLPILESRQHFTDSGIDLKIQHLAMGPNHNLVHFQGMDSQTFSMQLSLTIRMGNGKVAEGNSRLPEALLEASSAKLHLNSTVKTVTKCSRGFDITYTSDGDQKTTHADYVVIAAPMEKAGIKFINFESVIEQHGREWIPGYVYVITADRVNPQYFNADEDWAEPYVIMSTPSVTRTDGYIYHVLSKDTGETKYYTVVAASDITSKLPEIFINPTVKFMHHWEYAHPLLPPHTTEVNPYQKVVLAPGLYNLGVMYDIMDQMEGSVIAARNAALLIKEDVLGVS